jgi:hypothetical protein
MGYILVYGIMFIVVALISWQWVKGIDYMQKNHPDYKGEDLFGGFDDTVPGEETKNPDESEVEEETKNRV